jgi:hypothetical protein
MQVVNPYIADPTFGNLDVGDVRDDDAEIFHEFTSEIQAPPVPTQQTIHVVPPQLPKRLGRLITQTTPLPGASGQPSPPVQVLFPDPNRKNAVLRIYSPTGIATDFVYIADDQGKLQTVLQSANQYAVVFHGDNVNLDDYNGPIWAWAGSASAPMAISVIGLTE